jgi:methionyl-tRNA formyltransferase
MDGLLKKICVKIKVMKESVIFMGSPEFAVPILDVLSHNYTVNCVITQPDRPAGRGMKLCAPPVKELALSLGIPLFQPEKLNTDESFKQIKKINPDLIVVAAYGQILKPRVLEIPRFGCINVHASLLPRWRGASPIQNAIKAGDEKTGVTIMKMDVGMDTGAMIAQSEVAIMKTDTGGSLTDTLSRAGAELLIKTLPKYFTGSVQVVPQPQDGITYAHLIRKEEGELDVAQYTALELERKIRAFDPWPGTYLLVDNDRLKILQAKVIDSEGEKPGERSTLAGWPVIATKNGWLQLDVVQPAGKKPITGKQYLCGARDWVLYQKPCAE